MYKVVIYSNLKLRSDAATFTARFLVAAAKVIKLSLQFFVLCDLKSCMAEKKMLFTHNVHILRLP